MTTTVVNPTPTMTGQEIVDLTKKHTLFEWSAQAKVDPIPVARAKGKKNRNQQGQVDVNRETRKPQRHKSLHKERQQGNADRYRDTEPVDLNLLPRCVGYGHAIVDYSRRQAAGNWPAVARMACPVL